MKTCRIEFDFEAVAEFDSLDKGMRKRLLIQLEKLEKNPELGKTLGNVGGINLTGCRSLYFDDKRMRIVYKILEEKIVVLVLSIGKRRNEEAYKNAGKRNRKG